MTKLELDVCDSDGSEKVKPPSETEVIAELIAALEACSYELLTLEARLTPTFAKNAKACHERGYKAIKTAKDFYK